MFVNLRSLQRRSSFLGPWPRACPMLWLRSSVVSFKSLCLCSWRRERIVKAGFVLVTLLFMFMISFSRIVMHFVSKNFRIVDFSLFDDFFGMLHISNLVCVRFIMTQFKIYRIKLKLKLPGHTWPSVLNYTWTDKHHWSSHMLTFRAKTLISYLKMSRLWTFQVTCKTLPGEVVCVTGSCAELGNWKVNKIIPLEPQDTGYAGFGGEKE